MSSPLPQLQHSFSRSYLAGISPGSSRNLPSGICRTGARQIPRGFTLIEIALAIFIISILLGSILIPLTTRVEQRQVSETQKMLEDIKEALIGHAVANGRLPCPDRTTVGGGGANDTANDGVEDYDATTGLCLGTLSGSAVPPLLASTRRTVGNVPWVTLGFGASDPWGNRFRYAVDLEFSARSGTTGFLFTLASAADLGVCTSAACTSRLTSATAGEAAVAVILSHGKNGRSAINSLTGAANAAATSADELDNVNPPTFTSRTITPLGAAAGEFDDIVTWLSKYSLFNRMVAAGKLP
jgi:prepilin-type N-terminal cleavage/methylation domain-containing protein